MHTHITWHTRNTNNSDNIFKRTAINTRGGFYLPEGNIRCSRIFCDKFTYNTARSPREFATVTEPTGVKKNAATSLSVEVYLCQ